MSVVFSILAIALSFIALGLALTSRSSTPLIASSPAGYSASHVYLAYTCGLQLGQYRIMRVHATDPARIKELDADIAYYERQCDEFRPKDAKEPPR